MKPRNAWEKDKPVLLPELPRGKLEEVALRYLNRFDATRQKLMLVFTRYIRRHVTPEGREHAHAAAQLVLDRYEQNGILDDSRLSANHARALQQRGSSRRKTEHKLRGKGVPSAVIEATLLALETEEPGGDLLAARIYVRKRRLGPYRATEEARAELRQKDLATLARQGFSHDVAKQALASTEDDMF